MKRPKPGSSKEAYLEWMKSRGTLSEGQRGDIRATVEHYFSKLSGRHFDLAIDAVFRAATDFLLVNRIAPQRLQSKKGRRALMSNIRQLLKVSVTEAQFVSALEGADELVQFIFRVGDHYYPDGYALSRVCRHLDQETRTLVENLRREVASGSRREAAESIVEWNVDRFSRGRRLHAARHALALDLLAVWVQFGDERVRPHQTESKDVGEQWPWADFVGEVGRAIEFDFAAEGGCRWVYRQLRERASKAPGKRLRRGDVDRSALESDGFRALFVRLPGAPRVPAGIIDVLSVSGPEATSSSSSQPETLEETRWTTKKPTKARC